MATLPHPSETKLAMNVADARFVTNLALVAAWIVLSLCASFSLLGYSRDNVEYLVYYESIPATLSFQDSRFEPGFHLIAWTFRQVLRAPFEIMLAAIISISLAIKLTLFKRYLCHPILALIFYTVLFFPIQEYTQYRVALSLAFGYWGAHYILQRRFHWALPLFAAALSMHYSSLLLLLASFAGVMLRGRTAVVLIVVGAAIGAIVIEELRFQIADIFSILNPLSLSYLDNRAMIEGVSFLSVNNLLLAAVLLCAIFAGYYSRSRYHAFFLTVCLTSLVPIALLPDSPIIAQRSKEVLFLSVIFLMFRSKIGPGDLPAFGLFTALTGLLGYFWIDGGVILT